MRRRRCREMGEQKTNCSFMVFLLVRARLCGLIARPRCAITLLAAEFVRGCFFSLLCGGVDDGVEKNRTSDHLCARDYPRKQRSRARQCQAACGRRVNRNRLQETINLIRNLAESAAAKGVAGACVCVCECVKSVSKLRRHLSNI